ncbi:hypothetical protein EB796_023580 [Bugula neritina]|uniref:Uncharacterized protein n=1 Tax=Bugula neritina TaxID=10212 RepID=A0A7J7IW33_BUGNE|nr:hypothetical protein EB796_023580 [Bugula neritina]
MDAIGKFNPIQIAVSMTSSKEPIRKKQWYCNTRYLHYNSLVATRIIMVSAPSIPYLSEGCALPILCS